MGIDPSTEKAKKVLGRRNSIYVQKNGQTRPKSELVGVPSLCIDNENLENVKEDISRKPSEDKSVQFADTPSTLDDSSLALPRHNNQRRGSYDRRNSVERRHSFSNGSPKKQWVPKKSNSTGVSTNPSGKASRSNSNPPKLNNSPNKGSPQRR